MADRGDIDEETLAYAIAGRLWEMDVERPGKAAGQATKGKNAHSTYPGRKPSDITRECLHLISAKFYAILAKKEGQENASKIYRKEKD